MASRGPMAGLPATGSGWALVASADVIRFGRRQPLGATVVWSLPDSGSYAHVRVSSVTPAVGRSLTRRAGGYGLSNGGQSRSQGVTWGRRRRAYSQRPADYARG
jgi:hypothetical protein